MSFTIHDPLAIDKEPEFDCIFCEKPALHSSEVASTVTTRTVEIFCRKCGTRKTIKYKKNDDETRWETVD